MARRSAKALVSLKQRGLTTKDILTEASLHNAMAVFAAFGAAETSSIAFSSICHSRESTRIGIAAAIA